MRSERIAEIRAIARLMPDGTRVVLTGFPGPIHGTVAGTCVYVRDGNRLVGYVVALDDGQYLPNGAFVSLLLVHPDNLMREPKEGDDQ